MDEGGHRRQAVSENQRGDRPSRVHGRPDRAALWAVFVALAALVAAWLSAASADAAVRELQGRAGLTADGVVDGGTRDELRGGMKTRTASWYGPGFWRNETACGKKLRRKTIGVAHKRLPCGTKVVFNNGERWLRTKVIDRGPYAKGVNWDLTQRAAETLGTEVTEKVRSAVVKRR